MQLDSVILSDKKYKLNFNYDKTLVDLFEEQALATPQAVALVFGQTQLTYQQLNERANQLAHYLIRVGTEPGTCVGICLDRSAELFIGMLAILKAGGTYLPIDPEYSSDRIEYLIKDSRVRILITQHHHQNLIGKQSALLKILLHEVCDALDKETPANLMPAAGQNPLLCIFYSSSSTGNPKGVKIFQSAVLNLCYLMWHAYPFLPSEVGALKTPITSIDHIWEFFGPLLQGAPSVLFTNEDVHDTSRFLDKLVSQRVSRIILVPSLLKILLDKIKDDHIALPNLKYWLCSGEVLIHTLVDAFYRLFPDHVLINIYGSIEVSADITYFDTSSRRDSLGDNEQLQSLFGITIEDEVNTLVDAFQGRPEIIRSEGKSELAPHYYEATVSEPWQKETYIDFLKNDLLPNVVKVSHPSFVGHMTSTLPDFVKDLNALMVELNQNMVKIETSLKASAIERQVIGFMHRQVYKSDESFYQQNIQNPESCLGLITNGGTISNISALSYAMNSKLRADTNFGGIREEGLLKALEYYRYKGVAIIGSHLAHYSISKALGILGIGKSQYIRFDFDRNNPIASKKMLAIIIETLKNDHILVLAIIGVAGATETGQIDPLEQLGNIAHEHAIHFHVDAAFGGPSLFSSKLAVKLKGIEYADTVTICGHKQMYLPMGTSICLFKDKDFASHSQNSSFYQARKGSGDLGRYSIEGSRPFISLVLHGTLRILGEKEMGRLIEANTQKALLLADLIKTTNSFQLLFEPELNIVNYRYVPPSLQFKIKSGKILAGELDWVNEVNRQIQQIQFSRGNTFVSYTELLMQQPAFGVDEGRVVMMRAVLMNPYTTIAHLRAILKEQLDIAKEIVGDQHAYPEAALRLQGPI